ncbi:MAG: hypothetical protein LKE54_10720 [Prevotella sp.]|nr:hypothetical protein [Prevotella sp.]MCH3995490.1 hypothetical protein [Prevotella sp.]
MKIRHSLLGLALLSVAIPVFSQPIDRSQVVHRNCPVVTTLDSLQALTVGNSHFAFTVDATGLQTFPERYAHGVCLGTMSDWGWHSFPNTGHYRPEDAFVTKDFGRGHQEVYSAQFKAPGRPHDASNWLRENPHRLHLGVVGLDLTDPSKLSAIKEKLDLWTGSVQSSFAYGGRRYQVHTVCSPDKDEIASAIVSDDHPRIRFRFPYPTGGHSDDACDWSADKPHHTDILKSSSQEVVLRHTIDTTVYFIRVRWCGPANFKRLDKNDFILSPKGKKLNFTVSFYPVSTYHGPVQPGDDSYSVVSQEAARHWVSFWKKGAIVDFSHVSDPRARELERRVVLSQYLLAVNDAGSTPPQETGLTYNSWFGKFHLEMVWWHEAQFALWGHPELLAPSLDWYVKVLPVARSIAKRQGFKGVRWMKMTDPSGMEVPSNVGSYLIWQQPHPIYLAELLYRAEPAQSKKILARYGDMVNETATFMADFATYDSIRHRYILKGCIPAQETLKADSTVNPPFELSYWYFALRTAQKWRERRGVSRVSLWDKILSQLSPLAMNNDSLYLSAESAVNTFTSLRFTSDHPAVLGALGVLPASPLVRPSMMRKTLLWVWDHWNWPTTWGWDYPMTAMCAARVGEPERAVQALLMPKQKNTYLGNGHNYQDNRLRLYLPGNGGLLTAVAMMCAGWDGCTRPNPGFPVGWDVRWEGLLPLP